MTLNLVQHRSGASVWDREAGSEWDLERWLVAILSGALVAAGVRRGSTAGLLLTVGGVGLGLWAATEAESRTVRRGRLRQVWPLRRQAASDPVREASEESFPASDSPSWTSTTGNR
jgi:hypothetical protein